MAGTAYYTIASGASTEFKDRGSRFLGFAYQINNAAEIAKHLEQLRSGHKKAVHFCYAWRMGTDGMNYRANDDGEPGGTAGRPILGQIDSAGVVNTLVVVVRYFGGTLLGTGGLVNAYKTAAREVLAAAGKVPYDPPKAFTLRAGAKHYSEAMMIINRCRGTVLRTDYDGSYLFLLEIPGSRATEFEADCADRHGISAGGGE